MYRHVHEHCTCTRTCVLLVYTGYDELRCHCGGEVLYPPLACGTKPPPCDRVCARIHACDHQGTCTCTCIIHVHCIILGECLTLLASGSDPTCRVGCVAFRPARARERTHQLSGPCNLYKYRGAVFIHVQCTPTCCGVLCWLVYSTCCQNEN